MLYMSSFGLIAEYSMLKLIHKVSADREVSTTRAVNKAYS